MITTVSGPLETGMGGRWRDVLDINNGDGNGVTWNKFHGHNSTDVALNREPIPLCGRKNDPDQNVKGSMTSVLK